MLNYIKKFVKVCKTDTKNYHFFKPKNLYKYRCREFLFTREKR